MPLDFAGQNLRGRSFKGQNLTGANFSRADIRGADFSNTILREANFTGAKAGLPKRWKVGLVVAYECLAILSTFMSLGSISVLRNEFSNDFFESHALVLYFLLASTLVILTTTITQKGVIKGLIILLCALFPLGMLAIVGSSALIAYDTVLVSLSRAIGGALFIGVIVTAILSLLFSAIETITISSRIKTIAAIALFGGMVGSIIRVLARNGGFALVSIPPWNWAWIDLVWGCSWTWLLVLLGSYLSRSIMNETSQMAVVKRIPITMAAIQGTSFRKADLTSVDFSQASLKNTDLRAATLTHVSWFKVSGLHDAHVGNSYLKSSQILQLVTTLQGEGKNLNRLGLEGINFKDANLQDTSLIGTNLNNANLQNANLSRAILKQTQLDGADLTGAILTGAYIEDWGITGETRLNGVRCEYVYMRVPTRENPDPLRKPDNHDEVFEDEDFADFIRPLVNTLDLYHNQGVDPRAIAISFKELAENHPEAQLEIVAMEKKSGDKFLLRANTAPKADKSQLSAEYFSTYNQIKAMSAAELQALLAEKDSRIQSLEAMVVTALQSPKFYTETNIREVGTMTNNPGGVSQSNTGSMSGGMQAAIGDNNRQGMNTEITASEKVPTQVEVLELLLQLNQIIQTSALPEADKEKATTYLSAAKAEAEEKEPDKGLVAKNLERATKTLKAADEAMGTGTSLFEKIAPIIKTIAPWIGAAAGALLAMF